MNILDLAGDIEINNLIYAYDLLCSSVLEFNFDYNEPLEKGLIPF